MRRLEEAGEVTCNCTDDFQPHTCWGSVISLVTKCSDDRNNNFPPYRRLLLLFSFCFYLVDVGFDAWVAAEYYISDKQGTDKNAKNYLSATLVFIVVPCLILNLVSWALYTWGWLIYHNKKLKIRCKKRVKCLNYVEQEGISRNSFPVQGVYVFNWPRPSNGVDSPRQNSDRSTSHEMTERFSNQGVERKRKTPTGQLVEDDQDEIDFGLEFYPLDLLDLSEYIAVTILHLLLLGYLFRILRLVYISWKKHDEFNFDRYRDVSFLRLVESFLEAAPQVVLQLYLLVVHTEAVLWYRIVTPISIFFSITSLALSVGDYFSASQDIEYYDPPPSHQKRQKRLSWTAYIGIILWHFLMIVSRALSIALFATIYGSFVFLIIGIHYVAMVYWMFWQQARVFKRTETDFDDEEHCQVGHRYISWKLLSIPCRQLCDNYGIEFIVATFNVFFHFKIRDGGSQYTLIPFYLLTFIENALMIFLWYFGRDYSNPIWYAIPAIVTVFATYFAGLIIMILYYQFGLPSRKGTLIRDQPLDHPVMTSTLSRMYQRKTERGNFFKRVFRK